MKTLQWTYDSPSPKQVQFLAKLIGAEKADELVASGANKGQVSNLINSALAAQKSPKAAPVQKAAPKVEKGYYVDSSDTVYVVVESKTGNLYAKKLVITEASFNMQYGMSKKSAKWVYKPGMVYGLEGLQKLTAEKAAELGHLSGVCVVCTTQLTDPESCAYGIGPVCYKKLAGHARPKLSEREIAAKMAVAA